MHTMTNTVRVRFEDDISKGNPRTYTYRAPSTVAVGDRVVCPVPSFFDGHAKKMAVVWDLESDYEGPCRAVSHVLPRFHRS